MKIASFLCFAGFALLASRASADKAAVKVNDIDTNQDTSIVIKKGDVQSNCTEYTIVEGQEEVFGSPDYDKGKARQSWKAACKEWKDGIKELNRENSVLAMSCGRPTESKEGDQWIFKGPATYKIKTKVREKSR